MSFPRYKSYKESGVEWLGEVPSHWQIHPLKRLCDIRLSNVDKKSYDDEIKVRLCNYTDVYYQDHITDGLPLMEATATAEQIARFSLRADDVIITKDSETADDIAIAAYVPESLPNVVCGYHLALLRVRRDTCGVFIKRFFDSAAAKGQVEVRANGLTRVGLGQQALDDLIVATPPICEQQAIATFLDQETAKIDALVEAQRRLIALLKEKHQAVISHAVTKGIDPAAPMKPSSVEWLDDVPAHWKVTPLRYLVSSIEQGWSPQCENFPVKPGEWGVLKVGCVNGGFFRPDENKALPADLEPIAELGLARGDLLVSRANTRELVGSAAVVDDDYPRLLICDKLYRLRMKPASCAPELVAALLSTVGVRAQIELAATGASSSMLNISQTTILDVCVPVAPLEEQRSIIDRLYRETAILYKIGTTAHKTITLLQERRAALISAAVTGKIDVRDWSAVEVRDNVAAEIIHFNAQGRGLHRVKFQKLLYLAQTYAGIEEIDGRFERYAAGPHDGALVTSVEDALRAAGVVTVSQLGGVGSEVTYRAKSGTRPDHARLSAMLGDRLPKLEHLLKILGTEDMHGAEAVATLYAVWNDALLAGETPDDARLVRGFLDEWHEDKRKKFRRDDVMHRIGFLQRNGLTPEGRGRSTLGDRLL